MRQKRWMVAAGAVMLILSSGAWAVMGGGDISFPAEGMAQVVFSHDGHVGQAKLKCNECHYKIYTNHAQHKAVGMEGMRQGKSCGACHNGAKAFDVVSSQHCGKCHR